ncbi:sodium:proton antiporter [Sphingomonas sp.]|jgi:CPA1 family monovalent cation:H+ antiporter|uniref:cation:proton antiporter n=1 Tax=Sphingomonas sp. TaxID=28214 RepID=UPI002E2EBAEC|nr:sodium:proton antiporter [Sphingomonas sp.]HEX4695137.1 sodium:proton antiporter [Sphingomonas sp.]
MQGFDFQNLGLLLFVATIVAIVTRRLRLQYSVGLVAAGIALALLAPGSSPPLTPNLIYFVFLPPLVFEAAIQIPWRPFRRDMPLLLALVTLGVILAAGTVAVGMHYLSGWSWIGAGLFGVLIAATDPVAVIATFRQVKVPDRLHLLVEAESLLNDGVAAVGFAILVGVAGGGAAGPGAIGLQLFTTVAGGVVAGATVAVPLILLAGRSDDFLVEITLTMLIAYGSFLVAEHFHASGVLATLTAGMIVGNWGLLGAFTTQGRASVLRHWEYVAFLINSLIFMLIGGREATMPILIVIESAVLAVALSLLGRAVAVYPVTLAFARSSLRIPWAYKHVLFWGGLRGALALGLALALPGTIRERDEIVVVAFAVVAVSIFVQGLTMPWLIGKLGLNKPEPGPETEPRA